MFAIYVAPDRQGLGGGLRLWAAALGTGKLVVWVLESNAPALRFYERRDGAPFGERLFPVEAGSVREVGYSVGLDTEAESASQTEEAAP